MFPDVHREPRRGDRRPVHHSRLPEETGGASPGLRHQRRERLHEEVVHRLGGDGQEEEGEEPPELQEEGDFLSHGGEDT